MSNKGLYGSPTGRKDDIGVSKSKSVSILGGVVTLDCNIGSMFNISLNANISSFSILHIPPRGIYHSFAIELTADGNARTATWEFNGVNVKWMTQTNIAPTLTSTNGKKDVFVFTTYDNGITWLGYKAGQNG